MARTLLCIDISNDAATPITRDELDRACGAARAQLLSEAAEPGSTPRSGLAYLADDDDAAPMIVYWFLIGDQVLFARELIAAIAPSVGAGFG